MVKRILLCTIVLSTCILLLSANGRSVTAAPVQSTAAPTVIDPLPTADATSIVLGPTDSVKIPPVEVWRAINATFPPELVSWAIRTSWCESRWDTSVVGAAGERGIFQVQPSYFGPVPSDLLGQARQAAAIASEHGTHLWSTEYGCEGFNR